MENENLSIADLFDVADKKVPIQSVIDKLQSLMKDGYTTVSVKNDLGMYHPLIYGENDPIEPYIAFYKD